ncbi:hypothetical protein [Streptomyces caelestis]|uniref:hypothetical protein n=1 Tax=Streptomyces caelestis TaxID=36816 RepID=UPI003701DB64
MASICLFTMKGLLDQVPDVIDSAGNVRDAWDRFKKKGDESPKPEEPLPPPAEPEAEEPGLADDDEPPMAA